MPYADPEKHKQYHRDYNREYRRSNDAYRAHQNASYKQRYHEDSEFCARRKAQNAARLLAGINRRGWEWRIIARLKGQCSKCGYAEHPAALDFHHVGPKNFTINQQSVSKHGWAAVLAELEHVIVLCSNCHRILHCKRSNHGKARR